jgi:outer membrane protein assembly factor BamB
MDRALNAVRAALASLALMPLTAAGASAQSAQPIEGFWVPNGAVRAIEADGAGRVYLGGTFDTVGPYTGTSVRLDPATAALSLSSLSDGTVYAVAPDGAGGWYLGGNFTRVRGCPREHLAHILADGRVAAWNPGADYAVYALAVADGTVYVGGQFYQIAGQSRSYFAPLDAATGALVGPNLSPAISDFVYSFAVSGNTLYVGGRYFLSSYNRSTGSRIRSLPAMASNHSIVVSGSTVYTGGGATLTSGGVRSINATTGTTNWTTVTNGAVRAVAVIGSRVYFGGVFTTVGASLTPRDTLASVLASNGSLTSWDPNSAGNVGGVVYALGAQGTTLYVGGDFGAVGGATRHNLGAVDTTTDTNNALAWNPRANGRVWRLALDGGHLFAGGELSSAGGVDRRALAALDASTGALVDSWDPAPYWTSGGATSRVDALALGPAGSLYVAGGFNAIGGVSPRYNLAAVDYDGNGVSEFDAQSDGSVAALAASATSLYVSGQFSNIGGAFRPRLAALDPGTGSLQTAWNAGASGQQVDALAVESGLVYAGGGFSNIGGGARLVGLDPASGARNTTFDPRVNSQVFALKLQGSTLYAGGIFTSVNFPAITRNRMAGLDTVTGTADSFDPNVSHTSTPYVYAIAPWGSTVFAGGVFTTIGGQSRNNLAALDSFGSATSWNPGIGTEVRALKISHNTLYVGGDTGGGAGQYRRGFLAFCLVPSPSALIATPAGPNRIDLSWAGSGAPSYEVGRSRQAGGPYEAIGTAAGNAYSDTTAEGGVAYYYVVRAVNGCLSDPTPEASATTNGSCSLGPDFEGLAWARGAGAASCAIQLGWLAATTGCGDAVSYTVYRDTIPGFTPQDSNRVAAALSSTAYTDTSALTPDVNYYYVVRAQALASGIEDTNTITMGAAPSSCSATAPAPPRVLTVRAGDGENAVEWLNPGGPVSGVRLCAKDGSVPSGPADGDCSDLPAVPFERGSLTESVPDGTTRYYAIWADEGGGSYSPPLTSWGRPQSSGGSAFRWAYTTGATTLAPVGLYPGLGYFAASNDKILHQMAGTGGGGFWPDGWSPASINASGAWRPLIVRFTNTTIKGSKDVAFVAAQDGHVHAIDAGSGVQLWASPQLGGTGGSILTSPVATFSEFGASLDMLLVTASTSAGNGMLYGIHPSDGSIAWTFNNGGGANAIGLISGTPQVELTNPPRVYFTSRRAAGGSMDTAWCLSFSGASVAFEWSVDVGEADAGPILQNGKLYVGTLGGDVQALWPADGDVAWTWSTGDQAVKAYVWVSGSQIFFSTLTQVHGIVDGGASASPLWTGGVASVMGAITLGHPSAPLVRDGRVYVGNDDGRLYSIDATTDAPAAPTYLELGDPSVAKVIGPPAHDVSSNLLLSGSDQGVVYAVARPF